MQRRCDRNRKRSKRRAVHCPIHGCHLDGTGHKYRLFADRVGQLKERGISRRNALLLVANQTAVSIEGEWLESLWCEECRETKWYHVRKSKDNRYTLTVAPQELWQQVTGVINPEGNPSVGEFTRRQSRLVGSEGIKDFKFFC